MAGDIGIRERLIILGDTAGAAAAPETMRAIRQPQGRDMHYYGARVVIAEVQPGAEAEVRRAVGAEALTAQAEALAPSMRAALDETGQFGVDAFALRQSPEYRQAKSARPYAESSWAGGDQALNCSDPIPEAERMPPVAGARGAMAPAPAPTSARLTGRVAVGIIIVEGPTAALKFSADERTKVVAEVQNGLGWLGAQNPAGPVSFHYNIKIVTLDVQPGPATLDGGQREALWRDPAMARLGYSANFDGVRRYVEDIRINMRTDWTYCGFFTKYPLGHFAYASIGGPRLVMDYANDGWGPDNIDRVFAHETGHIFGAPDEYAASGCNCGGSWGFYGRPNSNCENCAPGGGVSCIMKSNSWEMCEYTPDHLGFPSGAFLALNNFGYNAGGWRVDKHPRIMTDVTGDGRADMVGFGNAGAYVSSANADGTFQQPQLAVANFGYDAGGWRVDKHPRMLADTTGDGRADIVGFGDAGAYVSRNNGNGTFQPPQLVVANFGYNAGGWRVENHPRMLADTTGDGRADIVGFGNAGAYVSRNNGNGTFQPPQLVVASFGYNAGGWRVENHPRMLADTTGDGRADIVGFGNAGAYVSRNNGNGTFQPPQLVVASFGYNAGGWRIDKHPRFVVDLSGDGRADIVGFGDAGVYVSRNNGNGTFQPPQLVVANFGYNAGGWRVESHPRMLADTTGDGRLDIVGFGNAGVYVSRNNGNGTFQSPQLTVRSFGYSAGGWRVESHPRFVVDINGDGRADIVGCGYAGIWAALSIQP